MPKPNSALSSKSELAQVGPRPAGSAVRRGGQVAAVDRGAARGVGDVEPVAEELGEQLDIRGLAATCAGARELKQRLQQLQVLDLRMRELVRSTSGRSRKNSQLSRSASRRGACGTMLMAFLLVSLLLFTDRRPRRRRSRCNLPVRPAACSDHFHALPLWLGPLEGCGGLVTEFGTVHLGADHGVRANHNALATLDAEVLVPHRDELRDVALFPLRGGCGKCAAGGNCADGEQVASPGCDFAQHIADELGRLAGDGRDEVEV